MALEQSGDEQMSVEEETQEDKARLERMWVKRKTRKRQRAKG